jgi:hypothetical protein
MLERERKIEHEREVEGQK